MVMLSNSKYSSVHISSHKQ